MKPLEEELKSALERQEAPAGFAGRVMARLPAETERHETWPSRLASLFKYPRLRWAATAALALVTIAGVWAVRRHEEHVKAEAAKAQVMFALRFAGGKLNHAMAQAEAMENKKTDTQESGNSE